MAIIGEPLKEYVINQINQRQISHGLGFDSQYNIERSEGNIALLNANNSWIKLASGVKVTGKKLKELGVPAFLQTNLSGSGLAQANVLFGGLSKYSDGKLTQANKFLGEGEAYQANAPWGIVPMPGIESIEVKSLTRGSLKKATVKLVAQTRDQLAILDVLYLRLGYTVLLEWGNSFYKKFDSTKVDNPDTPQNEQISIRQMGQTIIDNEDLFFSDKFDNVSYIDILPLIEKLREKHQGNYDALLGKISNFNWSFNNDGSYDIEITIMSLGDVVESLKSNVIAAHDTLSYVNSNSLGYTNESSTLDKARKDNIILSLLHVFKLLNHATFQTNPYEIIKTAGNPDAKPIYILNAGGDTITTADYTVNLSFTIGLWNFTKSDWIPAGGEFIDIYEAKERDEVYDEKNNPLPPGAFPIDPSVRKGKYWVAYGKPVPGISMDAQNKKETLSLWLYGSLTLRLKSEETKIKITDSKVFTDPQYQQYKVNTSVTPQTDFTDPISIYIKEFEDAMNATSRDKNWSATYNGTTYSILNLFLWPEKGIEDNLPENTKDLDQFQDNKIGTNALTPSHNIVASNPTTIPNPLKNTGYSTDLNNPQMTRSAFVLALDVPEYYIQFNYLLNLFSLKVVTRIDRGKSHNNNPNLFIIKTSKTDMACLPEQISFDWRKCIVARKGFTASNTTVDIFPDMPLWVEGTSQVADAMNIYLNFEFVAESLTSNLDEKGNVSVYNCIKTLCDGINIALGGVNNLEPIIDEDTNTLNIIDSTPNTTPHSSGGYELKLYGYSKGVINNENENLSTFVRKVDLKTAITPEYATMVTVGATAGGYVKGIEATAFARWNDGILDRFKEKLIAADKDIATTNATDENSDTVASFEQAMSWTAKCFGIDGGLLWDIFPM
jgi:hypothetical protein